MHYKHKDINILIVEDELLIAENLAMKLEKLAYNILDIVSSGNAAIKKSKQQKKSDQFMIFRLFF